MAVTADGGGYVASKGVRRTSRRRRTASRSSRQPRATATYNPPARRTSGGGGGGGGGGSSYRSPSNYSAGSTYRSQPGSVRTYGKAPSGPARKPKPKPPSVKSYLAGDVTYQDLVRNQQRTLADFMADLNRQRGEAKTSFGDVTRSMESERERSLKAMMDEYAARGLLSSGLYGEAQGNYQKDWAAQMSQLQQGQSSLLADLLSQQTNFQREQQLAAEAARQDAIRRRAQKYGIV